MSPAWDIDQPNLAQDLISTAWIKNKARDRPGYAQNIYAALCNRSWQKIDVMSILKDQSWSCTWRSAGDIVAGMIGSGDYLDWYCSGIRGNPQDDPDDDITQHYVAEGTITDEILEDFKTLGWQPFDPPKEKQS